MSFTNDHQPSTNGTTHADRVRKAFGFYLDRGRLPVPLLPNRKRPAVTDWPKFRPTPDDLDRHFPAGGDANIGLLLGAASSNLVDIDLDSPEAIAVAPYLLPTTGWVHGRASAPRSHHWYQVDEPPAKASERFVDPTATAGEPVDGDADEGDRGREGLLLELRSSGGQTVVPPSRHPSGEVLEWVTPVGQPTEIPIGELRRAVHEVAAAALLARHWPGRGSRDETALALAGGLIRAGWTPARVSLFTRAVAVAAGDEEVEARAAKAEPTAAKIRAGEDTTGWPRFAHLLGVAGDRVVARVREWLGLANDAAADAGAWPDPIPLAAVPDVPPFPVHVFPAPIRALVEEIAWALNCPTDYAAVPVLTLTGGALANARQLAIKRHHTQSACLYAAYVGRPGTTKSAPLKLLRRVFDATQARWRAEWEREMECWREAEEDERGPKPLLRRCVVSDTTTESLALILGDNPRGLVMIRNELAALMTSMNQYRSGGAGHDRQVYLNLWDGDPIVIDRKSDKARDGAPIVAADPFTAITGTLQPDVLAQLRGIARGGEPPPNDGFFDRFLIAYPKDLPAVGEEWRDVSDDALHAWERLIGRLLGLSMTTTDDGRLRPVFVHLTADGRQAWERFTREHAAEMNAADLPKGLFGVWAKLKGYGGRLALILHFMRWGLGEATSEDVDGVSLDRAAEVVGYFKAHARKVFAEMDTDPKTAAARKVLGWIVGGGRRRFTRRDVYQGVKGTFKTVDRLRDTLALLEQHGFVRERGPAARPGPGRKPSQEMEAHPTLFGPADPDDDDEGDPIDSGTSPVAPDPDSHNSHNRGTGVPAADEGLHSGNCGNSGNRVDGAPDGFEPTVFSPAPHSHNPHNSQNRTTPTPGEGAWVNSGNSGNCGNGVGIKGSTSRRPYRLVTGNADLEAVAGSLEESDAAGVDLETTGLDPRRDRVRLLSLATATGIFLIDCFAVDPRPLFPLFATRTLIFHNGVFDVQFLVKLGFVPCSVKDTMLMSQVLYAGDRAARHRLADCVDRELGIPVDKTEQKSDWGRAVLSAEQIRYAARDVDVLHPLHDALAAKIKDADLERVVDIEHRCLPAITWMSAAGVAVDAAAWKTLTAAAETDVERLTNELDAAAPPSPQQGFFPGSGWKWTSTSDITKAFAAAGVTLDGTDDATLATVDHPLAALLREFRGATKRTGTYGKEWLRHVTADGRVYAGWKQIGAGASGRMSCSGPNLQQLPRGREYRRCFAAPPGRVLVKADYSQIELRISATVTGDEAMLSAYREGRDLHVQTAQMVLGVTEVTKEQRQLSKSLNFGLLYGMGAKGLRQYAKSGYGVELTEEQAVTYRTDFFKAYPGLRKWHRSVPDATIETRTLAGRRRLGVNRFTEKLNSPIQGCGADGLKAALALLWERRDRVPSAVPVLAVHDEIVVECDAADGAAAKAWLVTAMVDGMQPLIDPVPVEVEAAVLPTWGG